MVPLSHGTCHKCDMLSGKQRETYGKPRCQKTPLSLLQAPSKPLSLIIPVLGTARRGTKSRKVTKKVSTSPRLCWLLFAKPDIPLPRSRTKMPRSPKGEKLLPSRHRASERSTLDNPTGTKGKMISQCGL